MHIPRKKCRKGGRPVSPVDDINDIKDQVYEQNMYQTIWVSIGLGFILGAAWCGLCKINERLDAPE